MARHGLRDRTYSIEFKRQVAQEFLGGEAYRQFVEPALR